MSPTKRTPSPQVGHRPLSRRRGSAGACRRRTRSRLTGGLLAAGGELVADRSARPGPSRGGRAAPRPRRWSGAGGPGPRRAGPCSGRPCRRACRCRSPTSAASWRAGRSGGRGARAPGRARGPSAGPSGTGGVSVGRSPPDHDLPRPRRGTRGPGRSRRPGSARRRAGSCRSAWICVPIWVATFAFGGGLGDDPGLVDRVGQRLLAVDVLAQPQRHHRRPGRGCGRPCSRRPRRCPSVSSILRKSL